MLNEQLKMYINYASDEMEVEFTQDPTHIEQFNHNVSEADIPKLINVHFYCSADGTATKVITVGVGYFYAPGQPFRYEYEVDLGQVEESQYPKIAKELIETALLTFRPEHSITEEEVIPGVSMDIFPQAEAILAGHNDFSLFIDDDVHSEEIRIATLKPS